MLAQLVLTHLLYFTSALHVHIRDKTNETHSTVASESDNWPNYGTWPLDGVKNWDTTLCTAWNNRGIGSPASTQTFYSSCIQIPLSYVDECCVLCAPGNSREVFATTYYGVNNCYIFNTMGDIPVARVRMFTETAAATPKTSTDDELPPQCLGVNQHSDLTLQGPISYPSRHLLHRLEMGGTMLSHFSGGRRACYKVDIIGSWSISVDAQHTFLRAPYDSVYAQLNDCGSYATRVISTFSDLDCLIAWSAPTASTAPLWPNVQTLLRIEHTMNDILTAPCTYIAGITFMDADAKNAVTGFTRNFATCSS